MNRGKRWAIALTALLGLLLAGVAWAQSSNHDLSWHVVAGGGREWMSSGSHLVNSTLGQFAIGPAAGGSHRLGAGYWYGIRRVAPPPPTFGLYLPLVMKHRVP
ncbi:MAG: hypothetical protein ACP5OO_02615 [Chloroflexia bacterium]